MSVNKNRFTGSVVGNLRRSCMKTSIFWASEKMRKRGSLSVRDQRKVLQTKLHRNPACIRPIMEPASPHSPRSSMWAGKASLPPHRASNQSHFANSTSGMENSKVQHIKDPRAPTQSAIPRPESFMWMWNAPNTQLANSLCILEESGPFAVVLSCLKFWDFIVSLGWSTLFS